jgi:hypothetical protein
MRTVIKLNVHLVLTVPARSSFVRDLKAGYPC